MGNTHFLYLSINFFTIIIPFIYSFHRAIKFNKHFLAFLISNGLTTLLFIIWDIYFTNLGVWGFNKKYILGIYLFNIPVEEILFFVCIPFACLFTFFCLNKFKKIPNAKYLEKYIHIFLFTISILFVIFYYNHKYTFFVFVSLPILIVILKYIFKIQWLYKLYITYFLLLIPFIIVNGILTGTGLQEPVVWYQVGQNMGIRILTIPIEDIFYGLELMLIQCTLFSYFVGKLSAGRVKN